MFLKFQILTFLLEFGIFYWTLITPSIDIPEAK